MKLSQRNEGKAKLPPLKSDIYTHSANYALRLGSQCHCSKNYLPTDYNHFSGVARVTYLKSDHDILCLTFVLYAPPY
jgi:hypothetical protein